MRVTAGNNRKIHRVREVHADHLVTGCGVRTPSRPQTTQEPLPECRHKGCDEAAQDDR